jgi:aspartate ammonia-lyase
MCFLPHSGSSLPAVNPIDEKTMVMFRSPLATLNGAQHFDEKAVRGLEPHEDRMREYAEQSVGIAALHNQELGFIRAAEIAAKAAETGRSVPEVLDEEEE